AKRAEEVLDIADRHKQGDEFRHVFKAVRPENLHNAKLVVKVSDERPSHSTPQTEGR
ncbi:hypothetical protein KIPB_017210, partial [Kipferlia bialata]